MQFKLLGHVGVSVIVTGSNPGHAGVRGNKRAGRLASIAGVTAGLQPGGQRSLKA